MSFASISSRSWESVSAREFFTASGRDARHGSTREDDDREELMLAAMEKLSTCDNTLPKQAQDGGEVDHEEGDFAILGNQEKKHLMGNVLKLVEEDHEKFLRRLRNRFDRVGMDIPKVEVRYEHLMVEGDAYVGSRALPTLLNSALNMFEGIVEKLNILTSKKSTVNILRRVSGILKPSRVALLLAPPRAGKTILLKALAGKLDKDLRVSGRISYCGYEMSEFIPQRTCSYISQHDLHHAEMTVRETLNFSRRCLGVGTGYDLFVELSRREKEAGIKPDPEIDEFMKAAAVASQESSSMTDYVLKLLGMDICADILVGDEMIRGISGGEKKRLTIGEMLVSPANVFYMDEISNGLDSATTFKIIKHMRQMVHIMDKTMIISLLQPAPEIFELFDDIILLSEGQVIYQGPRENILQFFESVGFKCPERKGVADFLQEISSIKDQEQYWFRKDEAYRYVTVAEFVEHFNSFHIGQKLLDELAVPYDKNKAHPGVLLTRNYGISNIELFKACLSREWLLMKRNFVFYIFKAVQITIISIMAFTVFLGTEKKSGQLARGGQFYGAMFFSLNTITFSCSTEFAVMALRLPQFYKQRDALFYPAWAFALPIWLLRIALSVMESSIWTVLTYYTIGFAPEASRFFCQFLALFALHQAALSLCRFVAALARTTVVANTLGTFALFFFFILGGFIIPRDDIKPWMIWGYYISPLTYSQNAIAINEFLDKRWATPNSDLRFSEPTVGKVLLKLRGMFLEEYMYWICIGALFAFSVLFDICFTIALTYLNPFEDSKSGVLDEDATENKNSYPAKNAVIQTSNKGMVLPFTPLSLAFNHVNYYVDRPAEMKRFGIQENQLTLLRDVSGSFRPGVLTALVGVTGAGKTTLMDVLAGRKTSGFIEGRIRVSGHPKNQDTFSRVTGYCEQTDINSPHVTVYESVVYSAWLRLSPDLSNETRRMFIEEVIELLELKTLRNALVGFPGMDGLSTEQRKRLTIAVELVANPSIIFMDEPTSGLDARAAAIVMRAVRDTVDTGRTVVCTIHQPNIDIFEAFDELLLMKRGGQVIYGGPLGHHSCLLIDYFQSVPGVPEIKQGYNPATWMLEISSPAMEVQLNVDFAEIYANSDLYRKNQDLIEQLSTPSPGSQALYFPTRYAQSFLRQCKACFWKQYFSYWRNPQYNSLRFLMTTIVGITFGLIFWQKGDKMHKQQDLLNLVGVMTSTVLFVGGLGSSTVQPVVSIERSVFYREKAAGMYSASAYAFGQVAIEIIYILIQTLIYCLILYSMIGFRWQADKFFWFYFFMLMTFVYLSACGMMLVAVTPNYPIAAVGISFFIIIWNLFVGFCIPRTEIPVWWRWYYWCSPLSWTIYGLVTSQVGEETNPIQVPGVGDIPLNEYLNSFMGFKYDFLGVVAVVHVAWALLFCLVFAAGIKYLNFQRR